MLIAHQRIIRERETDRPALASLGGCTVRAIDNATAKPIIVRYEWLRTQARITVVSYGLCAPDGELLGVVQFAKMTREANNVCGPEHADKAICLARGACVPHSPRNSASYLISRAVKLAHEAHRWAIVMGYADESAGELGSIYQALGWHYLGQGLGRAKGRPRENFRTPSGRVISERHLRYFGMTKNQALLIGWRLLTAPPKHKYVAFVGPEADALRAACRFPFRAPPKRGERLKLREHAVSLLNGDSKAARILGVLGGRATSAAKRRAARRNGRLGGKPKRS